VCPEGGNLLLNRLVGLSGERSDRPLEGDLARAARGKRRLTSPDGVSSDFHRVARWRGPSGEWCGRAERCASRD
jgi:hypothetical protein